MNTPLLGFKAFNIIPQFIIFEAPSLLIEEEIFIPNYGGIIIAVGLIFGVLTLLTSFLAGETIIRRVQGIIDITEDDEPTLHGLVLKVSKKMGMKPPRIGIVDDLRPNAFTVGGVKGPIVVFSSGLLTTLNKQELEAVTAHELGHIRNNDFGLLITISALKTAFFYNPLSFFVASLITRERIYGRYSRIENSSEDDSAPKSTYQNRISTPNSKRKPAFKRHNEALRLREDRLRKWTFFNTSSPRY